jgi:hypothetical protein
MIHSDVDTHRQLPGRGGRGHKEGSNAKGSRELHTEVLSCWILKSGNGK